MQCNKYGTSIDPNMNFCANCGCDVASMQEQEKELTNCKSCGQELIPNMKFCANCGRDIKIEPTSSINMSNTSTNISNTNTSNAQEKNTVYINDINSVKIEKDGTEFIFPKSFVTNYRRTRNLEYLIEAGVSASVSLFILNYYIFVYSNYELMGLVFFIGYCVTFGSSKILESIRLKELSTLIHIDKSEFEKFDKMFKSKNDKICNIVLSFITVLCFLYYMSSYSFLYSFFNAQFIIANIGVMVYAYKSFNIIIAFFAHFLMYIPIMILSEIYLNIVGSLFIN